MSCGVASGVWNGTAGGLINIGAHIAGNLDKIPAGFQALAGNPGGSIEAIGRATGFNDPVGNLGRGWDAMLNMSNHDKAEFWSSIVAGPIAGKFLPAGARVPVRSMAAGSDLARSGVAAEIAVGKAIGVARNVGEGRATVPGSGPGGLRIPDFDPLKTLAKTGTMDEVKWTTSLQKIPQLVDMVNYAVGAGGKLRIFSNATRFDAWITKQIAQERISIEPIPWPAGCAWCGPVVGTGTAAWGSTH